MTLLELEPRYFSDNSGRELGISFLCPCCKQVRLGIAFANPKDNGSPIAIVTDTGMPKIMTKLIHDDKEFDVPPGFLWAVTDYSFNNMTLTPSIDASKAGHWHGHIINGEIK